MPSNPLGVLLRNRRAGQHTLAWARPDLQATSSFELRSSAFEHGAPIPSRHRGHLRGGDVSPALSWTTPPAGTAELALIVQDPDVPFGKAASHALVAGLDPALGGLPEDGLAAATPVPGLVHGRGALGRRGWAGPMPVPSHGPHAYVFQLFAVDRPLGLHAGFRLKELLDALGGRVVGRARLDGTYEVA